MKRFKVVTVAVVALLALAVVFTGVVSAQSPMGRSGRQSTPPQVNQGSNGVCESRGSVEAYRSGRSGRERGMGGYWNGVTLMSTVAEELDLEVADIVAELDGDTTLREVITNHGGDPEAIVAKFVDARAAILAQLVEEGRVTQEQADTMLAHLEEETYEHLDEASLPYGDMGSGRGHCGGYGL